MLLTSYPGLLSGEFTLLKIPLDNPEVIEVEITDDWGFMRVDSMIFHPDGTLIMVTYPGNDTGRLQSDDNWDTAQFVARSRGQTDEWGVTIALRGEEVYVIHAHLERYDEGLDQSEFNIVRVEFE